MKKSIFITGVSGVGKSTTCYELNEVGYKAYDIEDIKGMFVWLDKNTGKVPIDHDNDDLEKVKNGDWVCDLSKLKALIEEEKSEVAFYCGSASNLDELLPLFYKVLLLKASPFEIKRRLASRAPKGPGEPRGFGHTEEVQDWVLSWKESWENNIKNKGAIEINANQSPEEVVADIRQVLDL